MDEVWKQFGSPVFWICTVVVGLLSALVMHYVLRGMDRWFDGWSSARKARREAKNERFRAELKLLSENADMVPLYVATENRLRTRAIMLSFACSVIFGFTFGSLTRGGPVLSTSAFAQFGVLMLCSLVFLWRGVVHFGNSIRHGEVLDSLFTKLSLERTGKKLVE
ncbi:hypothetical protein ABID97_003642 [Variovorax sp. OAS795]|uniref:hypothetical protein n=1 Tax=Variovorax sp. OAS795 TaxID=3034231 RepID=UPI00339167C4